jgi:arylsulfate sulfotransferase
MSSSLPAQVVKITLEPSVASPQPVGTSVMWKATATGLTGTLLYQFSVRPQNSSTYNIVRDFTLTNTLPWTSLQQGAYEVSVTVTPGGPKSYQAFAGYDFVSRVTAGVPVVSATQNPLVALYSAPPCTAGVVTVSFWPTAGNTIHQTTAGQTCVAGQSLNFYLAGMQATAQYTVQQTLVNGIQTTPGPLLSFKTGAVNVPLPSYSLLTPPNTQSSTTDDIMLMSFKALHNTPPFYPSGAAFDLHGNVLWYYWDPEFPANPEDGYVTRPVAGGTMLLLVGTENALREVDLAGNVVRETNKHPINQQLTKLGQDTIICLSHEGLRLPNGHTVTIGSVERLLDGVQGAGEVDVVGNMVIDLDENFQVAWTWNTFDFLDTSRQAVLNEKYSGECPLALAKIANDWTHANSLLLTSDGNLLISLRDQDWIVKFNYDNGAGNGNLIWTLGNDGNFSIDYNNPWPWFSHQHDIEFDGVNYEVFDNGNTRVAPPPVGVGGGNSRGYVFSLNETSMTAKVVLAQNLGTYSPSFGSAQLLENGNYAFLSGNINGQQSTQTVELLPSGTLNSAFLWQTAAYRWFRMPNLYTYTQ